MESPFGRRERSCICKCKKAIGALKYAAGGSSFLIRKRLAEASIMSRIVYGIQIWGSGATATVIRKVQSVQNLAMVWITGAHRRTSTKELLKTVGWLSIHQLVFYHGFLTIYKIRKNGSPYFNLRHLNSRGINRGRIGLTRRRWSGAILDLYNSLDPSIRFETKISAFKRKAKEWIKEHIGIFNSDD